MARILTMLQFRAVYQLGERSVRRLLHSGELAGIRTGAGWRIVDPGPELLQLMRMQATELAGVPFIRACEVAELMGVSERRVRRLAEVGKLQYRMKGARRLYALASIEAYMARRHGCRKQTHKDVRPWVRHWAREMLAKRLKEQGVVLPDFLQDEHADKPTNTAV